MANKDVNLVIRAKNEASKSLQQVQGALDSLKKAQDGVAASADKADKSLSSLAAEQDRLKNIKVASDELAKAKLRLDVAAGAADRLKGSLTEANQSLDMMKADAAKAAEALAALNARSAELATRKAAEKRALDAANAALSREAALMRELTNAKNAFNTASRLADTNPLKPARLSTATDRVTSAQSAVDSARSVQTDAKAAYAATAAQMSALSKEIGVLQNSQKGLAVEINNTEGRVTSLSADVAQATSVHQKLASAVQESSTELAQFAAQSARVSQASGDISAAIERVGSLMQALGRYSTGGSSFADPRTASQMQKLRGESDAASSSWRTLQGEIKRLAVEMKAAGGGTAEQAAQLQKLIAAARAAKSENEALAASMHKVMGSGQTLPPMFAKVATESQRLAAAQKSLGQVSKKAHQDLGQSVESAKDALIRMNRESRQAMSIGQRLRGEVLSLATAYIGLFGAINNIGAVLRNIQTMQGAETRLAVVFNGDPQKIGNEMAWLKGQAQRLGIEFGVLSDQYTKFGVSAQELGFRTAEMRKVFLALAEAGRVNKLSADDMNGVFLALTQMMQKGKVSAEELRGQMAERLPGAVTMMARAFGYGTDQLDDFYKAMAGGGLDVNADVMGKFADELNAKFGSELQASLQNTTASIGRFFNNLYQASLQFANGGFLTAFNDGLARLNAWFESKAGHEFFLGLGAAAGKAYAILVGFFDLMADFKTVIITFMALKFASWIVSVGASMSVGTTLMRAYRQEMAAARVAAAMLGQTVSVTRGAMVAMNTVAAAFGGWIPMLITAGLTVASIGAGYWATSVDTATSAMDEHDRIMTAVLAKYDQLKNKAQGWADVVTSVSLAEANANVRSMMTAFDDARSKLLSDFQIGPGSFDGAGAAIGRGGISYSKDAQAIINLNAALGSGKIKISDYVAEINKMYAATKNDSLRVFLEGLLDQAQAAQEAADKTAIAAEVAQNMGSTLPELSNALSVSEKRLIEVAEAADGMGESVKKALTPQERYVTALQDMVTKIPALSGELKKFKEATDLTTSAWTAFVAAVQTGDISKIANVGQLFWGGMKGIFGFGGAPAAPNYEAVYTAGRFGANSGQTEELVAAVTKLAEQMGISAKDLLTAMSFETGGTFDPTKMGGAGGKYLGLIQFSPDQQKKYGLSQQSSVTDQVVAAGQYLSGAGVKPGDGLAQIYAAILSGNAANLNASDTANGGVVSNVLSATSGEQFAGHKDRAAGLLAAYAGVATEVQKVTEEERKAAEEAKKHAEEVAKGAAATEKALSDLGFENDILKMQTEGLTKQAFIEEKIHALKSSNTALTAEQEAKARELLAKQYDYNEALKSEKGTKTDIEAIEDRISNLQSQKSSLGEIKDAYAARGDASGVASTQAQINGVNAELLKAISSAEAMYEAMGGDGADAAIAKLEALRMGIEGAGESTQRFRFTMDEVKSTIFDSMESGIVDMFKSFATAIANGENAIKSLGQAFRQFAANFLMEIAEMILKQALFNALSGFTKMLGGAVGGFMGLPGGVPVLSVHSGGIVGSTTGSGDVMASPAWFQNATRYHSGGIVGLQPNEMPAILQVGEEVLTANDPNHSRNRGSGGGSKTTKIVNMFDAASFVSEALKSAVGEEAILNHVRANPSAWRSALEG